jgi:DNA-binding MarR family transcriptional regulator
MSPSRATSAANMAPATLLREVARLHVRAQRQTDACRDVGITQCTILTELGRAPAMTLAELSRRLRLDKGWTSRAVDQLVEQGLVAKTGDDTDRRVVALSLTASGAAQHRRLETTLDAQVKRVIARVPSSERGGVARALRLLHNAYVAELSYGSPDSQEGTCRTTS